MRWKQKYSNPAERWFAWYPVKLYGSNEWCWMEKIYRRFYDASMGWFVIYGLTEEQVDIYKDFNI